MLATPVPVVEASDVHEIADAALKRLPEAVGSLTSVLAFPPVSARGDQRRVIAALREALRIIDELNAKPRMENTALREEVPIPRGGLAPWQARRAKELMNANLDRKLLLSQLAEKCGLSTRHFARAFRQSTGVPPHRWLLVRRIERAKELLHDPALSLAEVALACGFADQSHFTRMFAAAVGLSPGLWRRDAIVKLPLEMRPRPFK